MFIFLRDFFFAKQTFLSTMGDLAGIAAVIAASPESLNSIYSIHPMLPMGLAVLAYVGGAVSGRKTAR